MFTNPRTANLQLPPTAGVYQQGGPRGTFTRSKRKTRVRRSVSPLVYWEQFTGKPIVQINRELLKFEAHAWKTTLTAAQRLTWNTFAAGANMFAYDGGIHTPNGFQTFIRIQRHQNMLKFLPNQPGANMYPFATFNPPLGAWSQLATPNIVNLEVFGGNLLRIHYDNLPATADPFLLCTIARGTNVPKRPASWLATQEFDPFPDPLFPLASTDVRLDYPWYPTSQPRSLAVACWFEDLNSYAWGPYAYVIALT